MQADIFISPKALNDMRDTALILDASWIYPGFQGGAHIDMRDEFRRQHIPGSCFVDLNQLQDPEKIVDARLDVLTPPRPGVLTQLVTDKAGAGHDDLIVVSDMDGGAATAPFLRYCLLAEGFHNVRLLKGGLPEWRNIAKLAVSDSIEDAYYLDAASIEWPLADNDPLVRGMATDNVFMDYSAFLAANKDERAPHVIDARIGSNRVANLPGEYTPHNVPATHHISYGEIINDLGFWQDFQDPQKLARLFNSYCIGNDRPVITHCYFGMAASNMMTALELAGYPRGRIYAGGVIDYAVKSGLVQRPAAG